MSDSDDDRTAHQRLRAVVLPPAFEIGHASIIRENLFNLALADATKPILVYCTTYGGDAMEAISLGDTLDATKTMLKEPADIYGIISGYCMSAGTYVLQFCDRRKATNNSFIMVHGMTNNKFGPTDETNSKRDTELMQTLRRIWVDAYVDRSKKPRKYWEKIMMTNTPTYYTAQEALEVGLIDEVIDVKTTRSNRSARKSVDRVPVRSGASAIKSVRSSRSKAKSTTEVNNPEGATDNRGRHIVS